MGRRWRPSFSQTSQAIDGSHATLPSAKRHHRPGRALGGLDGLAPLDFQRARSRRLPYHTMPSGLERSCIHMALTRPIRGWKMTFSSSLSLLCIQEAISTTRAGGFHVYCSDVLVPGPNAPEQHQGTNSADLRCGNVWPTSTSLAHPCSNLPPRHSTRRNCHTHPVLLGSTISITTSVIFDIVRKTVPKPSSASPPCRIQSAGCSRAGRSLGLCSYRKVPWEVGVAFARTPVACEMGS